jgi:hypothetical protein
VQSQHDVATDHRTEARPGHPPPRYGLGPALGSDTVIAILMYSLKVAAIRACIGVNGSRVPGVVLPGISGSHIDSREGLAPRS